MLAEPLHIPPQDEISPSRRFARLAMLFEGSLVVFAVVLGWLVGCPPGRHLPEANDISGWLRGLGCGAAGSLPMLALLWLIVRFPLAPWSGLVRFVDREVLPLFNGLSVVQFAVISVLAGCGEEMLFRGVIQDVATGWFGLAAGVVVSSILFGLCHWLTATYAFLAALIGIYLSWLYGLCGGNLLVPIAAHAVYDFGALVMLVRWKDNRKETI